ncbi:PKD domain-containing protein [Ohtaekwangia kribbensis]|uniref:PKD domain-containing protein n=1 Tax=Ohtaekwangia kribbensis TaxID=688913 RepID=A0ABW3K145_9BACT
MKKQAFLLAVGCIYSCAVLAQGEVPVDMFTGTPSIEIPLWTVSDHDLAHPVYMTYRGGGVRVSDATGSYGIGWDLLAGGSVTRALKSLPDDFTGSGTDVRRGWLYKNASNVGVGSATNSFGNTSDLSTATCTDETSDYTYLNGLNYNMDTEPDVFSFSAGSLAGKFVFDNNDPNTIKLIPFQDVKVEAIPVSGTDKRIASFKITTNDGTVYTFAEVITANRWTIKGSGISTVEFNKRIFELYDLARYTTKIAYTSEWKLSKIESPSGASIDFGYSTSQLNSSSDTLKVGIRSGSSSALVSKNIYIAKTDTDQKKLLTITGSAGSRVTFSYLADLLNTVSVTDTKREGFSVTSFSFTYKNASFNRSFLTSIQEVPGCTIIPPYKFTYIGIDLATGKNSLPSSYSNSKDFWGFYNGKKNSLPYPKLYVYPALAPAERYRLLPIPGYSGQVITLDGADRTPDNYAMQIGSLETVSYPWGGVSSINYEPHTYYDDASVQTYQGGGLRVKSVVYFDGVNKSANMVKQFNYDESAGKTSGRLLVKPIFAIPTFEYRNPDDASVKSYATLAAGTAQDLYEHLTVRTRDDVIADQQGKPVGYKNVKVTRPGAGYATYEFSLPGIFGQASDGAWTATENKFARSSSCPSMGVVTGGGIFSYPHAINPNYDYERGQLMRQADFDATGVKVQELVYTYQLLYKTGTTASKVWGLAYEQYPNSSAGAYMFGKYYYLTDVTKAVQIEAVTTIDAVNSSSSIATQKEYTYGSTYHKLLTQVKSTNSDGSISYTRMKYPLDFGTLPANVDKALEMITRLQTTFRNGVVIEQVNTLVKPGDTEKTMGASLVRYNDFGTTQALPENWSTLRLTAGITNFVAADKVLQGATYVLQPDTRYEVVKTVSAYDSYGLPLSVIGIDKIPVSTHWGQNKTAPFLSIRNALHGQVAYSNFETNPISPLQRTGYEFSLSSSIYGAGRTGINAVHPIVKLTRTVEKASVSNYRLSFWLKKKDVAVSYRLVVKNTALTTTYYDQTFTVTPTGNKFEYFEKLIPVTSFPSSFVVELQGQFTGITPVSAPDLLPVMDDVAFYPETADILMYSYDVPFGVNAVTDSRGISSFTKYDDIGRVKYVLDQDYSILKKNTYQFSSVAAPTLKANISIQSPYYDYTALAFTATGNECLDGDATYEWNFGGGVILYGKMVNYTYTTTGSKTVTLTVTHPAFGSAVTDTETFTVTLKPLDATLCAKGIREFDTCPSPGNVVYTFTCAGITETPADYATIFSAGGYTLPGGETIQSYQWKKKFVSESSWSNAVTTATYTATKINEYTSNLQVQCELTTSSGRKIYSDIMTITVYCN